MEKINISIEISLNNKAGVKGEDGITHHSIIPTIYVGEATDPDSKDEFSLSTNWTNTALIIEKKGSDKQYLVSFTQFLEALDKAGLI